jgi:hypothetical protein
MSRFMRKGTTQFHFVPTIASASLVPTAAEVTAGERLDEQLAEVNGLSFSNSPIMVPDFASTFTSQIGGEDTSEDTSMVFYEDDTSNPIKAALAKGTTGYICAFYAGIAGATPAAGDDCDVWPIIVTSNSRQYTADNEAAKYQVNLAMSAPPGIEKTLT